MGNLIVACALGGMIAILFASVFHLVFGGSAGKLVTYIALSCLGFWLGHLIGGWLDVTNLRLGMLNLVSASIGSWSLLSFGRWLSIGNDDG